MDLPVLWFAIVGVLLGGYAVLDGFDLGVGLLHPFVKGETEKRLVMNSIGPLWDGNEVWLVTFGGALFSAFPEAYATVLSGLYLPFMALLAALIGRAVSIEFRSKVSSRLWKTYWDYSFCLSSFTVLFLSGMMVGNMLDGLSIEHREYVGGTFELFNPYALGVGGLAVSAAALHGCNFLFIKTEGELQSTIGRWRWPAFWVFLGFYLVLSAATLVRNPGVLDNFYKYPAGWLIVVLTILAIASIPRAFVRGLPTMAFLGSSCTILALVFNFGMALFPFIVRSNRGPEHHMEIHAAASSSGTLLTMAFIALIGMPFVLTYTGIIYWVFRGKTRLDDFSY